METVKKISSWLLPPILIIALLLPTYLDLPLSYHLWVLYVAVGVGILLYITLFTLFFDVSGWRIFFKEFWKSLGLGVLIYFIGYIFLFYVSWLSVAFVTPQIMKAEIIAVYRPIGKSRATWSIRLEDGTVSRAIARPGLNKFSGEVRVSVQRSWLADMIYYVDDTTEKK
ncbi:hypothetical protein LZQ00_00730 [Sphingobacterium sp. SRCM116780]|uniref:hypothetical protein n=1 Tax=Sphingobacterium sp. SRCM116780 TaxID=2907623 RepID=UPI001F48D0AF|nr:hypothetical protein [Sphingobacterium sp. SRCM116780]UIR56367.1 hypothetical protein LZQ00_00730 [Sphingobacterium sp. SRCM116780]